MRFLNAHCIKKHCPTNEGKNSTQKKVLLECLSAPRYLIPCALIFDRTLFLFGRDNKIKSFCNYCLFKTETGFRQILGSMVVYMLEHWDSSKPFFCFFLHCWDNVCWDNGHWYYCTTNCNKVPSKLGEHSSKFAGALRDLQFKSHPSPFLKY